MHGCGDGDEVGRIGFEPRSIRESDPVFDPRVRRRVTQLLAAHIGRHDAVEALGQADRRLAVAGGAVPRQVAALDERSEPGEELGRIARPAARVTLRQG